MHSLNGGCTPERSYSLVASPKVLVAVSVIGPRSSIVETIRRSMWLLRPLTRFTDDNHPATQLSSIELIDRMMCFRFIGHVLAEGARASNCQDPLGGINTDGPSIGELAGSSFLSSSNSCACRRRLDWHCTTARDISPCLCGQGLLILTNELSCFAGDCPFELILEQVLHLLYRQTPRAPRPECCLQH